MAITNSRINSTGSPVTVYTSTQNTAVTTMYICNTSSTTTAANVFVVPQGGTAGGSNQIYSQLPIAGNDTYVMEAERLLFEDGDTIQIEAGASGSLTITISYTGI